MPTGTVTPLTSIVEMIAGQSSKDVTVDTIAEQLETLSKGSAAITVTTADVTLTAMPSGQAQADTILATGTLTGNRNVIFPSVARAWHVVNGTTGAYTLTFKAASGTGVVVAQGSECSVRFDGTNMVQSSASVIGGGGNATAIDGVTVSGTPTANQILQASSGTAASWQPLPADIGVDFGTGGLTASLAIGFRAVRGHSIPANFAGSQGAALVASTGTAVITVNKNGSSIGTITYTTSATPVFATSGGSAESLAAGDLIEFVAPSSVDATLAGVRITILASR